MLIELPLKFCANKSYYPETFVWTQKYKSQNCLKK